jgi:hydrogenase maturation factor
MGGMKDHFFGDTPYPSSPGFKERATSREAALAAAPGAAALRDAVHGALLAAGERGATADEVAAALGRDKLAVRPRVTELSKENPPRAIKTARRRANESGLGAAVWRAT